MGILNLSADERVSTVAFSDKSIIVELADGRSISAPLSWYPKLANATPQQRGNWQKSGAGYGIHWPDIDEDLSTKGLLRGSKAPGCDQP